MATVRKCPNCGLDLTDAPTATCPLCGTAVVESTTLVGRGAKVWLVALFQFAAMSIFMVVFRFPRIMIAVFGVIILISTVLSAWLKSRPPVARAPQRRVAQPTLFKVLSLAVGLCSLACFCFLLFGFVTFANSWSDWQRYKGATYHQSDFLVDQVFFHRIGKGVDIYARGTVDSQREWMTLPHSQYPVRNQSELEERVPAGTSIPIYFFPGMKGRLRVRPYQEIPTADAYHRDAINALEYGLGGLAICGGILFILLRLRAGCFEQSENALAAGA
jgi:hypothetical protein